MSKLQINNDIRRVVFQKTSEDGSMTLTYDHDNKQVRSGRPCGDSYFNRSSSQSKNISFNVITDSSNKNDDILKDENLIYVLNRLKHLYTRKDDTFIAINRSSFIFLTRIIRLTTKIDGREILRLAVELNKKTKSNIYVCLFNADLIHDFKRVSLNNDYSGISLNTITAHYLKSQFNRCNINRVLSSINYSRSLSFNLVFFNVNKSKSYYNKLLLENKMIYSISSKNSLYLNHKKNGTNYTYVITNVFTKKDFNKLELYSKKLTDLSLNDKNMVKFTNEYQKLLKFLKSKQI